MSIAAQTNIHGGGTGATRAVIVSRDPPAVKRAVKGAMSLKKSTALAAVGRILSPRNGRATLRSLSYQFYHLLRGRQMTSRYVGAQCRLNDLRSRTLLPVVISACQLIGASRDLALPWATPWMQIGLFNTESAA